MKKYYFTSESVTKGHPDKMCDLIADTILDEYLKQDKYSRTAIEVFAMKNKIVVAGQVASKAKINIQEIVKKVIKQIGYDNEKIGIDYKSCEIEINIEKQSRDIEIGIENGGAGDQGIMFGYACLETKNYMPFGIYIAHKLSEKLDNVRKQNIISYLKPDGKTEVTVEYEDDNIKRIDSIVVSSQHDEKIQLNTIKKDIYEKVIKKVIPYKYIDNDTKIYINPTGRFVIGGPLADVGLTGRKIIVDTYGGYSKHGGGAFSGKDPTKVDRSATYMARHIAKNIVANKLAKKCEIQLSYAIGVDKPLSIYINTFNTSKIPEEDLIKLINKNFNLTPNGIIKYLNLRQPIYAKTTNYGHFGKEDLSWENIIKL